VKAGGWHNKEGETDPQRGDGGCLEYVEQGPYRGGGEKIHRKQKHNVRVGRKACFDMMGSRGGKEVKTKDGKLHIYPFRGGKGGGKGLQGVSITSQEENNDGRQEPVKFGWVDRLLDPYTK